MLSRFCFEGSENGTVFFWALSKKPFVSVRLSVNYSVTDDIFTCWDSSDSVFLTGRDWRL